MPAEPLGPTPTPDPSRRGPVRRRVGPRRAALDGALARLPGDKVKWAKSVTRVGSARWDLDEVGGRMVEVVGGRGPSAALTAVAALLRDAQVRREPVAWIAPPGSTFHPPDLAVQGVDLDALPVLRPATRVAAWRIADELLRCGAFGLVILDGAPPDEMPMAVQVRLSNLARQHDAGFVCIADPVDRAAWEVDGAARRRPRRGIHAAGDDAAPAGPGSLVSLRIEASCERSAPGRFRCRIHASKDKRRGDTWTVSFDCDGTPGLR